MKIFQCIILVLLYLQPFYLRAADAGSFSSCAVWFGAAASVDSGSSKISARTVLQQSIKLFSRLIARSFSMAYVSLLSPISHQNALLSNRNGATERNVIFLWVSPNSSAFMRSRLKRNHSLTQNF